MILWFSKSDRIPNMNYSGSRLSQSLLGQNFLVLIDRRLLWTGELVFKIISYQLAILRSRLSIQVVPSSEN